jgi:hypothetical protein
MGSRLRSNWLRLALLQSLLIFTVSAGADVHQTDRNRDRDHGSDADGSLGGGPREGGGHQGGNQGGGRNGGGGHQDDDFDQDHDNGGGRHDGGRGDNDGGWGRDRDGRDGRGGHDRGDRGGGRHGGGRGGHNRPDPNPYDPNYPESPCQRDPRFCNGGGGNNGGGNNGGWDQEIQRAVYLNQVFQQQYLDLNYLVGTQIGSLQGYGLTGVDVEILNSWGPSTIRLINNSRQIDVQNVYGQYVQLNSYLPLDLFYGNRVNLGIQGRVHIGQIVLHFSPLGRR